MNFRYSWFEDATAHKTHTKRPASHGRVDGHAEDVRFVSFLNSLVWKYAQGFHEHTGTVARLIRKLKFY